MEQSLFEIDALKLNGEEKVLVHQRPAANNNEVVTRTPILVKIQDITIRIEAVSDSGDYFDTYLTVSYTEESKSLLIGCSRIFCSDHYRNQCDYNPSIESISIEGKNAEYLTCFTVDNNCSISKFKMSNTHLDSLTLNSLPCEIDIDKNSAITQRFTIENSIYSRNKSGRICIQKSNVGDMDLSDYRERLELEIKDDAKINSLIYKPSQEEGQELKLDIKITGPGNHIGALDINCKNFKTPSIETGNCIFEKIYVDFIEGEINPRNPPHIDLSGSTITGEIYISDSTIKSSYISLPKIRSAFIPTIKSAIKPMGFKSFKTIAKWFFLGDKFPLTVLWTNQPRIQAYIGVIWILHKSLLM